MGEDASSPLDEAEAVILPVPYEGGVSYGKGAAGGPDAIIEASAYVELYDEVLGCEPYKKGIFTAAPPSIQKSPEAMHDSLYSDLRNLLDLNKYVIMLGGDHSISSAYARALNEKHGRLSVIQFDAHADLRNSYEGSVFSHASVMSRIREITPDVLQVGIRSLCIEEAELIDSRSLNVFMMRELRKSSSDLEKAIAALPDPVFITFDVDVLDWSVISSTGTPEPGGMMWDEVTDIMCMIAESKRVCGFDIVELSGDSTSRNSAFAAARLAYRMYGLFG